MPYIQQRTDSKGNIRYRVQIRLKGCPPRSRTFERKTDARRWAQKTETEIRDGRHFAGIESRKHTLSQLIDRYLRDVAPALKSAGDRQRQLRWWKQQIGAYTLADVTPALIVECRDHLANGHTNRGSQRSPATVNRYMAALSSAITVGLKEWGWIEDSPFRKINTLRESRGRVRCLDEEERKRLLEACMERSRLLYVVLVVALSSGARKNEIMTLKWSQVDLTHGLFTLHETKNSEWRSVPLQGRALELVRELAKVRRLDTDLLFPSHKDPNKPLSINTIWKRAVKDAGLVDFRFHDTRHCAASYLLMSGATLAELSELLGHKSLQMVKRYSHMTTPHAAKIVEKMNREIFG